MTLFRVTGVCSWPARLHQPQGVAQLGHRDSPLQGSVAPSRPCSCRFQLNIQLSRFAKFPDLGVFLQTTQLGKHSPGCPRVPIGEGSTSTLSGRPPSASATLRAAGTLEKVLDGDRGEAGPLSGLTAPSTPRTVRCRSVSC